MEVSLSSGNMGLVLLWVPGHPSVLHYSGCVVKKVNSWGQIFACFHLIGLIIDRTEFIKSLYWNRKWEEATPGINSNRRKITIAWVCMKYLTSQKNDMMKILSIATNAFVINRQATSAFNLAFATALQTQKRMWPLSFGGSVLIHVCCSDF